MLGLWNAIRHQRCELITQCTAKADGCGRNGSVLNDLFLFGCMLSPDNYNIFYAF